MSITVGSLFMKFNFLSYRNHHRISSIAGAAVGSLNYYCVVIDAMREVGNGLLEGDI